MAHLRPKSLLSCAVLVDQAVGTEMWRPVILPATQHRHAEPMRLMLVRLCGTDSPTSRCKPMTGFPNLKVGSRGPSLSTYAGSSSRSCSSSGHNPYTSAAGDDRTTPEIALSAARYALAQYHRECGYSRYTTTQIVSPATFCLLLAMRYRAVFSRFRGPHVSTSGAPVDSGRALALWHPYHPGPTRFEPSPTNTPTRFDSCAMRLASSARQRRGWYGLTSAAWTSSCARLPSTARRHRRSGLDDMGAVAYTFCAACDGLIPAALDSHVPSPTDELLLPAAACAYRVDFAPPTLLGGVRTSPTDERRAHCYYLRLRWRASRVFLCCVTVSWMRGAGITDAGLAIRALAGVRSPPRAPPSSRVARRHLSPV
ncbi:hypothetical protein C8J57DRAFT_1510053 [Mycena rebaudengoi]|nr:hypothetical protein C8J57DRAFT_1510053 [Mycena rebaudengoi]